MSFFYIESVLSMCIENMICHIPEICAERRMGCVSHDKMT